MHELLSSGCKSSINIMPLLPTSSVITEVVAIKLNVSKQAPSRYVEYSLRKSLSNSMLLK